MTDITIYQHPKYTNYGCDEQGNIYNIKNQPKKVSPFGKQYVFYASVYGERIKQYGNRFIYECINQKQLDQNQHVFLKGDKNSHVVANMVVKTFHKKSADEIEAQIAKLVKQRAHAPARRIDENEVKEEKKA